MSYENQFGKNDISKEYLKKSEEGKELEEQTKNLAGPTYHAEKRTCDNCGNDTFIIYDLTIDENISYCVKCNAQH